MAVLIGAEEGSDPPATAAAFLVGGLGAMVVIGVATAARTTWGKAQPASDDNAAARGLGADGPSIGALVRSDLGMWSRLHRRLLRHSCPEHGNVPTANSHYWPPKLERNLARDKRVNEALEAVGWTVIRVWEHSPPDEVISEIVATLQGE